MPYCDVTLAGNTVKVITGSHCVFNGEVVALPGGQNLIYLRIAPNGTKFCAIGNSDDHCWEWIDGKWVQHPGIAYGPQSVMYDRASVLHIHHGPTATGLRYANSSNEIISCDATRADLTREIWEYTEIDDLVIGQGGDALGHGDDPIIAIYRNRRILLQDGRCRFINVYRNGNSVAYACVRQDTNESIIRQLTIADIVASPDVGTPPPPVAFEKEKPPEKIEIGKYPQFADLKAILAQSKQTDNSLYQTVAVLIDRLSQYKGSMVADLDKLSNSANAGPRNFASKAGTYITKDDESGDLPQSVQLLAGEGITFDDSVANIRVIHVNSESIGYYDAPLTDGDEDETDLIFANGECIIVQVPT